MNQKKILLVSPFPPYIGGVSISSERLFNRLVMDGYIVEKYDIRFKSRRLNSFKILKVLRFFLLPFFIKRKFDIVHFHVSGVYARLYISLIRKLFSSRIRFIMTIHGESKNLVKHKFGFMSLSTVDVIICTNPGDKIILDKNVQAKIFEIPAYINPFQTVNNKLPKSIEQFLQYPGFKIVFNGAIIVNDRYHDLYGFKDSLELIKDIKETIEVKLLIINLGNKSGKKGLQFIIELKKFIEENRLQQNVVWYEREPLDFSMVLRRADLFLRPTKTDGDSVSLREALYLKVPTIASDVVKRPEGTITYYSKNNAELTEKVFGVFKNPKFFSEQIQESMDFYSEIKNVYDQSL